MTTIHEDYIKVVRWYGAEVTVLINHCSLDPKYREAQTKRANTYENFTNELRYL